MNEQTMISGACPKCGSTEVYTTQGLPKRGERMILTVSSMKYFFLDTYICTNCGRFEECVSDEELKDPKIIEKIKETWKKVK